MAKPHLRFEEREVISQMMSAGHSTPEIAKSLRRDPTTIRRELRRNSHGGQYSAVHAQRCAEKRHVQARTKSRKMLRAENLEYVQERLRKYWSPDQIAGRSRQDFPTNSGRKLSAPTIYAWLYGDDHARRWKVYLRRYRCRRARTKSPGRTERALAQRPAIINERGRYGDWEGDTIVSAKGVFVSLVERCSGYLALLPLPNKKADKVQRSICGRMLKLPPELRRSLTFDNGTEFAHYVAMETALGLPVFFTDPHSPWQRGTNENTNGLVRQFHPKGINLSDSSRYKVAQTEKLLNERPRKRLNYQTPSEVLASLGYRAIQT